MIYAFKNRFLLFLGISFMLAFAGCQKETDNYDLVVTATVYDSVKVSNALVRIYAPVKDTYLDYYQYTDEKGEARFIVDRKAVVEVIAGKGGFNACSFKELFNGGNSMTIDIKPFGTVDNGCP
jgi:hypothetical protein